MHIIKIILLYIYINTGIVYINYVIHLNTFFLRILIKIIQKLYKISYIHILTLYLYTHITQINLVDYEDIRKLHFFKVVIFYMTI